MKVRKQVEVLDANGKPIEGVELVLDGVRLLSDETDGSFEFSLDLAQGHTIEANAEGYLGSGTFHGTGANLPNIIYLAKPDEPWYYLWNGFRAVFQDRRLEILVVLRDLHPDKVKIVKDLARQHGYENMNVSDPFADCSLAQEGRSSLTNQAVVITLPSELAEKYGETVQMFGLDSNISFAGPLLVLADDFCHASGLERRIWVSPKTQQMELFKQGQDLVEQWGGKYDYQAGVIEFGPDAGWKILDALNAIVESGLFSQFELERWENLELD